MAEAPAAAAIWLLCFAAAVVISAAPPRRVAAWPPDGLPADGLPADGLPADGLPADGLPADGLLPDSPRPGAALAGPATRPPAFLRVHAPLPVAGNWPHGPGGSRPGGRRAAARGGISGLFEPAGRRGPRGRPGRGSGGWWTCPPPGCHCAATRWPCWPAAAWAGLLCYPALLLPGMAGAVVLTVLAAAALTAGAGGVLALARWPAQPAEATFDGQVIARWVERRGCGDDDVYVPCFAVDDGQRAWSADTSRGAFGRLAVGDPVRVRASPRSGKLPGLDTPGAAPSGPAREAPPAVTDPVPAPGAAGAGTGLPAVVYVARLTAKITFIGWRGPAHAGVLPGLAAAVAARLSDHVTRP